LMCFAHVSLVSRCIPRYFTSFFWGGAILPICTAGQVWVPRGNVTCVDLLWFILILCFFSQSPILLLLAWSFTEAIAGSSRVAKKRQIYANYLNILYRSPSWEMVFMACHSLGHSDHLFNGRRIELLYLDRCLQIASENLPTCIGCNHA
jgi:hypothetical protein